MFQLIVAVVGIALVVILSILAIWVGGQAFTTSNERATFATYFNQGSQIEGALKMYAADQGVLPTVENDEALLRLLQQNEYLTTIPEGDWEIVETSIYRALDGDPEQCRRLNEFVGKDTNRLDDDHPDWDGCPPCGVSRDAENAEAINALAAPYRDWPGCRRISSL